MSQENVELARRGMESMEAFFALLDEYVVADNRAFPLPDYSGVVVGRDKFIEMSRHYWGAWDDYRIEGEEFIDAGQSVVIAMHERGRGKGSGVRLDRRWALIWTFREGRIVRWEPRRSTEDAVKAAGLPAQATSQENVEIARRAYEAATRRPKPDFGTVNALYHPDHEFVSLASRVEGRSFFGALGFREVLESYADTFESWDVSIEEIKGIDVERVLIVAVVSAMGRRRGVDVEQRFVHMLTVRDGKVVRTETFSSPEAALEALGLRE